MAPNWPRPGRYGRIPKHRHSRHAGRDLLEQLQPFPADARIRTTMKPVVLPPGRARLSTKPAPTGSATDGEHDRHGACRLQQRPRSRTASSQDDVRRELRPIPPRICERVRRRSRPSGCRCARCGRRSSPIALSACANASDAALRFRIVRRVSASTPMRRIRSGCCARAASGQAAAAPPTSVMNSRRFIRSPRRRGRAAIGGTVRPSAFAVLRLTTRSNLVGCSTGMSPGFAPRRILST